MNLEDCLDDLYQLGVIQGEHNINWQDEYNLLEYSKNYYNKTKAIADKYGITYKDLPEDSDDEEYWLWDRRAFDMNENLINLIKNYFKEI